MRQETLVRRLLFPLRRTPIHPQWHVFRDARRSLRHLGGLATGVVLDIGAGEMEVKKYLPSGCEYLGLDYYVTAKDWYRTRPGVFGDGQRLPIASNSIDTVLLLDVLEHLPRPDDCIAEAHRVLRSGGKLIIRVPFLYPLHDEPYDFQRWTCHGLKALAARHHFGREADTSSGHPVETAALLMNLALGKTLLNWARKRNPLVILAPVFLLLIPSINIFAWLVAALSSQDPFMPQSYHAVWKKPL
jgi:SAM-dependent methyltransferase